ncbi:MAG: hypothetical protein JST92_26870 [Deltaproteobacteria bacterium]|nr:hypothetical protein [Deltaproteobacteria bacterium]
MHTGASTPATALIATGARFGVADPREHTVALIDPAAPDAPVWKAPVAGEPAAIDYDGNKLYVAYADSNNVDTFDGITGAPAGRMVFPVAAGNEVKCGQGSVVDASGAANTESRYLAMSRRSHAIISLNADSLSINAPIPLAQGTSPGRAVVRDRDLLPLDNSTIWVMHDSELGTLGNQTGRDVETVRISGLTTPPDCLLFPPTGELVMVAGNEVSLYRDDQRVGAVQVQGEIIHAAVDPKGRIVVISGDPTQPGGSPKAATYDLAALAAGGAPVETFAGTTKFAGFLGALNTYYGPMLFFNWDTTALASGGFGLILQDGLVPTEPMDSLVNLDGPLLTSPDGGIIAWTRKANPDNTLRFVDLQTDDLQHGLFDYATIKLGGAPVALTYDPTGAYLYVPVPELDEIEVFQ